MSTEYNIPNLFLEAFGLKVSDGYTIPTGNEQNENSAKYNNNIQMNDDQNEVKEFSSFGTPILQTITFEQGTYKIYNNKGELITKKMNSYRLPTSSIISLSRSKNMSETPINGGLGSVKEIYGFDDWKIKIQGFIIPDNSQPQNLTTVRQQEDELTKWDYIAESIGVINENLISKNIKFLTIESIQIEPMRGKPNIRQFSIDAVSDEPLFLNINSQVGI